MDLFFPKLHDYKELKIYIHILDNHSRPNESLLSKKEPKNPVDFYSTLNDLQFGKCRKRK